MKSSLFEGPERVARSSFNCQATTKWNQADSFYSKDYNIACK